MIKISKLGEIFAMGNYGKYVWASFGVVLITLIFSYYLARQRLKKAINEQKKLTQQKKDSKK